MNRQQRRGQKKAKSTFSPVPAGYAEALKYYQARRWGDAQIWIQKALNQNARHADSLHLAGLIAQAQSRPDLAWPFLMRAMDLKPMESVYLNNAALTLMALGDFRQAALYCEKAVQASPHFAAAYDNWGAALERLGDVTQAEKRYRQALDLHPALVIAHCHLAGLLYTKKDVASAIERYQKALAIDPACALAHHNLGRLYHEQGQADEAQHHLQHALILDPADRYGARILLAALGAEPVPAMASEAYLRHLYAQRATAWEEKTAYYAPQLVAEALMRVLPGTGLDILDAGCGTGWMGPLVRAQARCLEGVDLSPEMLRSAAAKAVYDHLFCGDLIQLMKARLDTYDAVLAAATFIHFGDLAPVFTAVHLALRPGGVCIFTLFPSSEREEDMRALPAEGDGLAQGGCFMHGRGHLRAQAAASGFSVVEILEKIHELHDSQPVPGLVVTLRKIEKDRLR